MRQQRAQLPAHPGSLSGLGQDISYSDWRRGLYLDRPRDQLALAALSSGIEGRSARAASPELQKQAPEQSVYL